MTTAAVSGKLKALARDLTKDYPRSPRETLAGFIIAARVVDKCRAVLNGTNGEYNFDCPMDKIFFGFSGIDANEFKNFVATGASDEEIADWITRHTARTRTEIVKWNNEHRYKTLREMPDEFQVFMEDYIEQNIPKGRVIYHAFDIFDIEEKRL